MAKDRFQGGFSLLTFCRSSSFFMSPNLILTSTRLLLLLLLLYSYFSTVIPRRPKQHTLVPLFPSVTKIFNKSSCHYSLSSYLPSIPLTFSRLVASSFFSISLQNSLQDSLSLLPLSYLPVILPTPFPRCYFLLFHLSPK